MKKNKKTEKYTKNCFMTPLKCSGIIQNAQKNKEKRFKIVDILQKTFFLSNLIMFLHFVRDAKRFG